MSAVTDYPSGHEALCLTFCNLTHEVRCGVGLRFMRESKRLLNGISGAFHSGELTAIIGPSGCGKTTLMDILTGYIELQAGSIHLDGTEKNMNVRCSYIMQDDLLQPLLTVNEVMKFAARLKLKSRNLQEKKVRDILNTVGLSNKLSTQVGKLSGGEMRKLSIAIEIITEPSIIFLDEPTSGLDSSSAEKCMSALKAIASRGVMVICSIHQPSGSIWEMLDHIYVMTSGLCTFQGSPIKLMEYLNALGLTCPKHYNPADHILEITLEEYGNNLSRLVTESRNGANGVWRQNCRPIPAAGDILKIESDKSKPSPCDMKRLLNSSFKSQRCHKVPLVTQFSVLLERTAKSLLRDKVTTQIRFFIHVIMGLFIGIMYWRIGGDSAYVHDNYSLLFYSMMFVMFTSFSGMITAFHCKLRITTREYFNDWYSLKAFYLAENVVDTIFQILCSTSYALLVYLMSAQPWDPKRLMLFASACAITSLISQTWGQLTGIALRLKHAVVFGSLVIMPWVVFAGFFLRLQDAPWFSHWLFHINFLKYGFQCALLSVYGYNRPPMPCSQDYCHFKIPHKFLKHLDLQHADYSPGFITLLAILVCSKIVTYHVLKYQLKHKRKKLEDED